MRFGILTAALLFAASPALAQSGSTGTGSYLGGSGGGTDRPGVGVEDASRGIASPLPNDGRGGMMEPGRGLNRPDDPPLGDRYSAMPPGGDRPLRSNNGDPDLSETLRPAQSPR